MDENIELIKQALFLEKRNRLEAVFLNKLGNMRSEEFWQIRTHTIFQNSRFIIELMSVVIFNLITVR